MHVVIQPAWSLLVVSLVVGGEERVNASSIVAHGLRISASPPAIAVFDTGQRRKN